MKLPWVLPPSLETPKSGGISLLMACSWRALAALCPSCSQTLHQAAGRPSVGPKFSPGLTHRLALSAPSHQLSSGRWLLPVPHAPGPLHVSVLSGNDFPELSVGDVSSVGLPSASVEYGTQVPSLYYGCLCHQTYRPQGQGLDLLGSPPHLPHSDQSPVLQMWCGGDGHIPGVNAFR